MNENVGGHATMHLAIRDALATLNGAGDDNVVATFFDVPPPTIAQRVLSATVPGLGRADADLQPLRDQLVRSALVRRHLAGLEALPDVLHMYTHNVGLLSSRLIRRQPAVVSLDATNAQNAYRLPHRQPTRVTPAVVAVTKPLERAVYDAASLVVAQSEWAAASLREDYDVDPGRVRVIPFGITVPALQARVPETALPRITFVGRSMERKGGFRLLRLWRDALRHRCRLTLVTLETVAAEPGLEVINDIRPGDGRMADLLASTAVFAFPTELDTFGYAAVEAMAAAVPVVATRTAALPEVVDEGVTGLLVEPDDDAGLVAAVASLLDDPERGRRMGVAGRQRVLDRFDAQVTTRSLVQVLREAHDLGPRERTRRSRRR